jgi:DNA-binding transcriptional regulator YhcF (GntR family)
MGKRQLRSSLIHPPPPTQLRHATEAKKVLPIPRQSLASAVMERLREQVLSGELREGQQLRQDAIATEFQIGRIPVREALSHLVAEGLITLVANRGVVVSSLAPEEIEQLFETRAVLECNRARRAPGIQKSSGDCHSSFHGALRPYSFFLSVHECGRKSKSPRNRLPEPIASIS